MAGRTWIKYCAILIVAILLIVGYSSVFFKPSKGSYIYIQWAGDQNKPQKELLIYDRENEYKPVEHPPVHYELDSEKFLAIINYCNTLGLLGDSNLPVTDRYVLEVSFKKKHSFIALDNVSREKFDKMADFMINSLRDKNSVQVEQTFNYIRTVQYLK